MPRGRWTYSHVASVGLWANLADEGDRGSLCERGNGILVKLVLEGALSLVKALVENDRRLLHTLGLGESGIASGTEEVVVPEGRGHGTKGLVGDLVISSKVSNEDDLISRLEILDGGLVDDRDGRQSLLGHV